MANPVLVRQSYHTVEHGPIVKSPLASHNQLEGLVWCTLDHITTRSRNLQVCTGMPLGYGGFATPVLWGFMTKFKKALKLIGWKQVDFE